MMQTKLIGYLLNALEDDELGYVEEILVTSETARRQLEILRFALLPLGTSATHETPPDNLAARTCALVRNIRRTELPQPD